MGAHCNALYRTGPSAVFPVSGYGLGYGCLVIEHAELVVGGDQEPDKEQAH